MANIPPAILDFSNIAPSKTQSTEFLMANMPPAYFTKKNPPPPAHNIIIAAPETGWHTTLLTMDYQWLETVSVNEEVDGALHVT